MDYYDIGHTMGVLLTSIVMTLNRDAHPMVIGGIVAVGYLITAALIGALGNLR